jgi:hypothetical protein
MSRRIYPIKNTDRTNRNAYAVAVAAVLVHSHGGAMDSKFLRRLHLSSNRMSSVFAHNRKLF